jgi:hypothetical protein
LSNTHVLKYLWPVSSTYFMYCCHHKPADALQLHKWLSRNRNNGSLKSPNRVGFRLVVWQQWLAPNRSLCQGDGCFESFLFFSYYPTKVFVTSNSNIALLPVFQHRALLLDSDRRHTSVIILIGGSTVLLVASNPVGWNQCCLFFLWRYP